MDNKNTKKTHRSHEGKKKLISRIVAWILAILMIAGMAYYTIYIMALSAQAADSTVVDASSLAESGDVLVRVGLMYGDGVTTGFEINTENCYTVGIVEERSFTPIWDIWLNRVAVTVDSNLSKQDSTYAVAYDIANASVGGFHVQLDCDHLSIQEFQTFYAEVKDTLAAWGLSVIPAYVYTGYTLRIGRFMTWDSAESILESLKQQYPDNVLYVTGGSNTSLSVIDPASDTILFEFDCGPEKELGLRARKNSVGNTYIQTPANNVYEGTFAFSRSNGGVAVTNLVPLESYVAGVLPYEVNNEWPLEALKAFAITVRSYTLTHMNRHSTYGFDICNSTHCQMYCGAGRINQNVLQAIQETIGQVMTYGGEIVPAYYASSMGGTTVDVRDVWGSNQEIPYLKAISTPWEDYMHHSDAFWIVEISPYDLAARLRQAGYSQLTGAVANVQILEFARNSTYIKKLQVTDTNGSTIQINTCDAIRTALSPYVKSANFVIGLNSVTYSETTPVQVVNNTATGGNTTASDEPYVEEVGLPYEILSNCHILTHQEEVLPDTDVSASVSILTSTGDYMYSRQGAYILTSDAVAEQGKTEEQGKTQVNGSTNAENSTTKTAGTTILKQAYAETNGNFIIVGKGSGHGVGISQYGTYDLAKQGMQATDILQAYFSGIVICDYKQANPISY